MKILVTGATGLVGVNLVRRLCKDGYDVRVLVRRNSNRKGFEGIRVEEVIGDVRDYESVKNAMKGVRYVYHVAGVVDMSRFFKKEMENVNIKGTENVCRAALESGVERLVHTSTISAVGTGPSKDQPWDENCEWNFGPLNNPYCTTKYEGEKVVHSYVKKGLNAVIVNPAYMFGPWDIKPTSGRMIVTIAKYGIPGYPGGGNNFVDVEDVVEGHLLAMAKGKTGERYILANENLTYKEIFTIIAEVVGRKPPRFYIPKSILVPVSYIGDILGIFAPDTFKDFNSSTVSFGYTTQYVTAKKAIKELGFKQTPVRVAVEKAYRWFKDNGYC